MTNLPVTGTFRITATYGQRGPYWKDGHKGIDFTDNNHTIYSTCYGTVRVVSYDAGGWGQYISIGDDAGRRHIFCHLERDSVRVRVGERVTPLTVIGTMGATGNVTGLHLHYQLQQGSVVVDPAPYLGIPNKIGTYHSKDFETGGEVADLDFKDANEIPEWAREAVKKVVEKGWMQGDSEGTFRPNEPVTRAELAVVLSRMM